MNTTICPRVNSAARWHKAAQRAASEDVQVRQLAGSGAWIATSGTDRALAYEVSVTGNVAHDCDCLAGLNGDPVCKHRAAFYLLIGAIDLDPEPAPPAPVLANCPECYGGGVLYSRELERLGLFYPKCHVCTGTGTSPVPVVSIAA